MGHSGSDQEHDRWFYTFGGDCGNAETAWLDGPQPPAYFLRLWLVSCLLILAIVRCILLRAKRAGTSDLECGGPPEQDNGVSEDCVQEEIERVDMKKPRLEHLDFARVVCVYCVVHEHSGGSSFSRNNTFFVLQWVLPLLFMTSGMSFFLSKRPLHTYLLRLAVCFVFGVLMNFLAAVLTDFDWRAKPLDVIYQMFYAVMIAFCAVLFLPLRSAARGLSRWRALVVALYGTVVIACWAAQAAGFPEAVDIPELPQAFRRTLNQSFAFIYDVSSVGFLAAIGLAVGTGDLLGWVMLLFILGMRVAVPYAYAGFAHNLQLYAWALVVQARPLRGAERIAAWVRAYWPLLLCGMMTCITHETGRCDLFPSPVAFARFRFYLARGLRDRSGLRIRGHGCLRPERRPPLVERVGFVCLHLPRILGQVVTNPLWGRR
eukprot:CAMPEP_0176038354 /NCGR_PEP_ID=MMETSP0120_2-20121206/19006_1 /TAXON_ID=160619 /ORGANISM="Kryptoperidinium foliaceum, Strain CCMP 1326" /LENGTH=430 /DNA_ID=CAMNT_0017371745 /DNA_START=66 /DNA_END=1354 /DNA_ORIENTATION=-